jgi:hypothetical protein
VAKRKPQVSDSNHSALVSDLVQVGGVFSSFILALVLADTARIRIAILLAGCAAVVLMRVIYLLSSKRPRGRRLHLRVGAQAALAIAMIAIAAVLASSAASTATETNAPVPTGAADGTPPPLMDKENYVLRPSSSVDTNDKDKVDLDTGCPGWGEMFPHIGPRRCGGLADLVVEPDAIHTADDQPAIVVLPPGVEGTYLSCHSRLTSEPNASVSSLPASGLKDGEAMCIRTDQGNTALVQLDKVPKDDLGQLTSVTIEFKLWTT